MAIPLLFGTNFSNGKLKAKEAEIEEENKIYFFFITIVPFLLNEH